MGFNTNITICNDNLSDYAENPERFVAIIRDNVLHGAEVWGITIQPTDHADATQLIAVGGNFSTRVYCGYVNGSHHTEDGQVNILRQWADLLGYEIVKK